MSGQESNNDGASGFSDPNNLMQKMTEEERERLKIKIKEMSKKKAELSKKKEALSKEEEELEKKIEECEAMLESNALDAVDYDEHKFEIYQKALSEGQANDNSIRVNVVGCFNQGKTLLTNILVGKDSNSVKSTNGVEISSCKYSNAAEGVKDIEWSSPKSRDYLEVFRLLEMNQCDPFNADGDLQFWDFGGQFIFYATHTLFHSRNSVYLMVFDLTKPLSAIIEDAAFPIEPVGKSMQQYAEYLMRSIHTYVGSDDGLHPPVILVGTHKDLLKGDENTRQKFADDYFDNIRELFEDSPIINHIQAKHFVVDCTNPNDSCIVELRKEIIYLGSYLQGTRIPARWLPLENGLLANRYKKIILYNEVVEIDAKNEFPLRDEEQIKVFLLYQHSKGNLIYFDEEPLSAYVVLDTQYVIDAFKCIITSERFSKKEQTYRHLWKTLTLEAKLEMQLLERVWSNDAENNFLEHKDLLLMLLQRLHIISEALSYDDETEQTKGLGWYFVPCFLRSYRASDVLKEFVTGRKHTLLKFVMSFYIPPVVQIMFNRVIAALIGKWEIVSIKISGQEKQVLLYKNLGVFKLDRQHVGIIELHQGFIELQVQTLCNSNINAAIVDLFRRYVVSNVPNEFRKHRQTSAMKTSPFEICFKCNHDSHCLDGSQHTVSLEELKDTTVKHCSDMVSGHTINTRKAHYEWFPGDLNIGLKTDFVLKEKDLSKLSTTVGENWEKLGVELGLFNVQLEQIKSNYPRTEMSIFMMLLTWTVQKQEDATLNTLIQSMKSATGVSIDWDEVQNIVEQMASTNSIKLSPKTIDRKGNGRNQFNSEASLNNFGRSPRIQPMQGEKEKRHNFVSRQSEKISTQILNTRANRENVYESQSNVAGGQLSVEVGQLGLDSDHIFSRSPRDDCLYDGRLINLTEDTIKNLRNENNVQIGRGSFGKVYKSLHPSKYFKMHVVVKKIPLNDGQERTIRREMITSRILHPFILPLLAAVEQPIQDGKNEFWLISPLCSEGDLYNVLKDDRMPNKGLRLNPVKRVKILLQVALAIEYIHTAVPDVRAVILHKDIACKNIVLDDNYNARLIDFGLAREEDDDTTTAGGRPYYTHPHVGKQDARESWDYYSFGVIVREMISIFGPEGNGTKYLKFMTAEEVTVNENIWGGDNLENADGKLNKMATKLLKQTDWKVEYFTKYIIQELKKIYTNMGHSFILDVSDVINDQTCHSCMINKKANQTSLVQIHKGNCYQKIEVCIACEKNSFLNPVTCYCGSKLSPTIGHRWGAILVAGNDTKVQYRAVISKALAKDVKELEKLLTSHAPRVFGISGNNVRTVVPSANEESHVEEKLWPKVKDNFKYFSQTTDIDTLFIYFSCHGEQSRGAGKSGDFHFQLGATEDDSITLEQFDEELERLENIERLIIILDRCYPPLVRFKNRDRVYVQINSCMQNQKAEMDSNGSIFTRYLISGLKAKSERIICPDTCQPCNDYWSKSKNFITVHNLFDYIKCHLREQTPIYTQNLYNHDNNIAFYTGTRVEIQFSHKNTSKSIPLDYLKDMKELKKKLKEEFGQEKEVCIRRDTFRKKKKAGELENDDVCDTLDKVMVAWVQRQRLEVTFNS